MSCLFWTNSLFARHRVVRKLGRAIEHLKHCSLPTDWDAIELLDAARRAVKYDHGVVYSGGLKKYRRAR